MSDHHIEFSKAVHGLRERDFNETVAVILGRLKNFPRNPQKSTSGERTGLFCDTTWDETIGSSVIPYPVSFVDMVTAFNAIEELVVSIQASETSAAPQTTVDLFTAIQSRASSAAAHTYGEMGYTYDLREESESDIRALCERLLGIDVTGCLWIINKSPNGGTIARVLSKCVANIERLSHMLSEMQFIEYK